MANKTHRCGERDSKAGHPPRAFALPAPCPTQGLWTRDLQAVWWRLCGPRSCAQPVLGAEGSGQSRLHPQAHRAMSTAPWAHISPGTLLSPLPYRLSAVPSPHFLPFGVLPWPVLVTSSHPDPGSMGCLESAPPLTGSIRLWAHTQAHTCLHMHMHTHPHVHTYIHTATCTHRGTYTHRHTCTHTHAPHTPHRQDWSGCCWCLQSPHGHSLLALPWGGRSRCQINWEKLTWADISEPSACSPKLF